MPKRKRPEPRKASKSKSGFFGVKCSGKKWKGRIRIDGEQVFLKGTFATALECAHAYDLEGIKHRIPPAKLNFPDQVPVGYTPKQRTLSKRNTVGYRGVYVTMNKSNFQAQITIGGLQTYIGNYDTVIEAAVAYDRAVLKNNRSTTLLNFPGMVHNLNVEPPQHKKRKRKKSVKKKKKIAVHIQEKKNQIEGRDGNLKKPSSKELEVSELMANWGARS